ncbi:MAG: DUF1887 family protein [Clostridia bacterium]|nr:DUF1887 family protein [Clostridia bacterium]
MTSGFTLVEFFDSAACKNICACLTHAPARVIFVGGSGKLMRRHIELYQEVFASRGLTVECIYKTVGKSNLEQAVRLLSEIVETYDSVMLDITGGDELLTLALGIVVSRYPGKNIQLHRMNLANNTVYDYDMDGKPASFSAPALSVEENIRIHGGEVVYGGVEEENTYRWNLDDAFVRDIGRIWRICKRDVRLWNTQIGVFDAASEVGEVSGDGLTVSVAVPVLKQELFRRRAKFVTADGILSDLRHFGLIRQYDADDQTLTVSFADKQIKRCLTKAGNALELATFLAAKNAVEKDGAPSYHDVQNGVVIDWDGTFCEVGEDGCFDTENEIDVILMHGAVPVFVSCKNGFVESSELYKLSTVAQRFGGTLAKKVLVATAIDSLGEAGEYLRARAKDMRIKLIENVQDLDDAAFAKKMRGLWK